MAGMFLGRRQITPAGGARGPAWDDHVATTPWPGGEGDSRVTSPIQDGYEAAQWRGGRNVTEERYMTAMSGRNQVTSPRMSERIVTATTEERNMTSTTNAPWRGDRKSPAMTEERYVTSGKSQVSSSTKDNQEFSSWRGGRKVTTTTEETHVTTMTSKSHSYASNESHQVAPPPPKRFGRQITTVEERNMTTSTGKNQVSASWRGEGNVATTDDRYVTKTTGKTQVSAPWRGERNVKTTADERYVTKTTGRNKVAVSDRGGKPTPAWLSGKNENIEIEKENVRVVTEERQVNTSRGQSQQTAVWREGRNVTESTSSTSTWKNQVAPTPAQRKKITTATEEKKFITSREEEKVLTEVQNTRVDFHRLASPHLAKSEVLKMLTEQEHGHQGYHEYHHDHHGHHVQHMDWPPPAHEQPSSFFTAIETDEVKKVAWPPVEPVGDGDQPLREYQAVHSVQRHKNSPPPPSTMALRQEIPLRQPPQEIYQSTPTAKKEAKRWRGDLKWPPEYCREVPEEQQPKKETVKPKRQHKDYTNFFAAHELPNNYPGYRVPPGTQYYGTHGGAPGHSDM